MEIIPPTPIWWGRSGGWGGMWITQAQTSRLAENTFGSTVQCFNLGVM